MSLKKRLLKHDMTQALLGRMLALFIQLVYFANRKIHHVDDAARPYMRGEGNAIFAFWHGRMMLLPAFCPPGHAMRVLISHHRDGKLISTVIGHFGQQTISGSSSRGGKEAVAEILRALERGDNISITPDGPRGPAQIAAPGVAALARLSGKAVLPVTFSSTRHKRFSSWDRFMLALPLGRIVFCVGAPIMIEKDADEEQARLTIEQAMNALVKRADEAAANA
jgi:lysophospholipid acyltransferase (LPLAT)-like uncharacterized protein